MYSFGNDLIRINIWQASGNPLTHVSQLVTHTGCLQIHNAKTFFWQMSKHWKPLKTYRGSCQGSKYLQPTSFFGFPCKLANRSSEARTDEKQLNLSDRAHLSRRGDQLDSCDDWSFCFHSAHSVVTAVTHQQIWSSDAKCEQPKCCWIEKPPLPSHERNAPFSPYSIQNARFIVPSTSISCMLTEWSVSDAGSAAAKWKKTWRNISST